MIFPLDSGGISLIAAISAIILLATSEVLSSYHGKATILINKKRLRNAAIAFSIFFLITVIIQIIQIISTI